MRKLYKYMYVCMCACGVKGSDGRMDDGYTEHSGCPVLEGEKWITTVWMRDGVGTTPLVIIWYVYV